MRFSKFLHRFVTDVLPVASFLEQVKEERPKQISDIRTLDGNVEIGASKEALNFKENSDSFIY